MEIKPGQLFKHRHVDRKVESWRYYRVTDTLGDKLRVEMIEWESDGGYWREVEKPFEILKEYIVELAGRKEIIFK